MTIKTRIINSINKIRPFLQRDGGDIEFISFIDGYVHIKVIGQCTSCGLSDEHIKDGLEIILQEEVDGVIGLKIDE